MCKKSQIVLTYNMGLIRTNQIKELFASVSAGVVFKTTFYVIYTQGSIKIVFKVQGLTIQSVILN